MLKATVAVGRVSPRPHDDATHPDHRPPTPHRSTTRQVQAGHAASTVVPAVDLRVRSARPSTERRLPLRPGWRPSELPSRLPEDAPVLVAGPAARPMRLGSHHSLRPGWVARRPQAAERLAPIMVAIFLLVAAITAAPGLVSQASGAGSTAGSAPRLVVGGPAGPHGEPVAPEAVAGIGTVGTVGSGQTTVAEGGTDGSGPQDAAATAAGPAQVDGQFLTDGTLLKPVVVNASVEDGRDQLRHYTVKNGDTLGSIAARFGVSVKTVWNANRIGSISGLHAGQRLVIPPVNGKIITVKEGDTLSGVASANRVNPETILTFNGLTDPTLVIGQVLILPGARLSPVPTPKPSPTPTQRPRVVTRTGGGGGSVHRTPHYGGGRLLWPVVGGYISQYYHGGHPALDIAAPYGTAIRAAGGGVVTYAGWKNNGGGYQVWISHGGNLYTTYNHMSSVAVGVGQSVGAGQFIGRVGATGAATGPHCHFEVWIGPIWNGGTRVNPLNYL